jgi:hypothetical protein
MNGIVNYQTTIGTTIMILSIMVVPKDKAIIKFLHVDGIEVEKCKLIMAGNNYLSWGFDDNYIGEYCITTLTNNTAHIVI